MAHFLQPERFSRRFNACYSFGPFAPATPQMLYNAIMRIVQLLPSMNMGGVERGVAELVQALSTAGHECAVISRRGGLCDAVIAGGGRHVEFDCGSKNILTAPARIRRLRALLRECAPDIVHVRSRVPAWLLHFAGGAFAVVSTFHGIYHVSAYSRQMTRADAVICPSRAVREHITRYYHVAPQRLHLIPRGVDMQYFNPARTDADFCRLLQARWRLAGHTVFTIAGRASALKGHALFLRAFARLYHRASFARPPLALLVGNDNVDRTIRLARLAADLGIGDAVRFGGASRRMREVYAVSDVVVSASLQPEAFGRTVAEALAMRRPVAAPAHGGALDIVRSGDNGMLFTPGNAAALAQALQQAAALSRDGLRESVAAFTLPRMVEQTQAVYEQVYRGRG